MKLLLLLQFTGLIRMKVLAKKRLKAPFGPKQRKWVLVTPNYPIALQRVWLKLTLLPRKLGLTLKPQRTYLVCSLSLTYWTLPVPGLWLTNIPARETRQMQALLVTSLIPKQEYLAKKIRLLKEITLVALMRGLTLKVS